MHVDRYVDSLFNLLDLLGALVVTLIDDGAYELHRGSCRLCGGCDTKKFLQPHLLLTTIWGEEVYCLSFCLCVLQVCCQLGHRHSLGDAYTLALLLDGGLYAGPYNVVDGKFVTEDNLLVLVDVYDGCKTCIVRCEVVEECRILTEMIYVIKVVSAYFGVSEEKQKTAAYGLF